ncbi:MBL fold metallo-hydrolase [Cellvibrio sp. NN19]|uniref:MBL fold metallo-hydrolase n=1 Tax=Cellvibrio chitinivorans TaxID=3102792 RepID=UPI002B406B7E|nr:MBL fold metallo-hydrolase [Cellvibrio sp. NN19]
MSKILQSIALLGISSSLLLAGCNDSSDSSPSSSSSSSLSSSSQAVSSLSSSSSSQSSAPATELTTLEKVTAKSTNYMWNRVRPLDLNPANDSSVPLERACIPTETLIYNGSPLIAQEDSRYSIQPGDFVICLDNGDDKQITVADSRGWTYSVSQSSVNNTKNFPSSWLAFDREFLVWAYERDTIIFRDAIDKTFEGNFFYLLLDRDDSGKISEALLIDTGAGYSNLAPYIYPVIGDKPLTVINTHSHWDHFGGNTYLDFLPNVKFYGYQPGDDYVPYPVYPQYSLAGLFDQALDIDVDQGIKTLSIGKREIKLMLDPGHTADTVILYDTKEKLLFTSDTVCHCGAFIEYWPQYRKTLEKLIDFTKTNEVTWALGAHLEFSKKRTWNDLHEYFLFGSNTHVEEETLQVAPSEIQENYEQLLRYEVKQGDTVNPAYDAHEIDKIYHERPYTVIPYPNIAKYYGPSDSNMSGQIQKRQAEFLDSLK